MEEKKKLEMYGGLFGGLAPIIILIAGLIWLSVAERGGTSPFWAVAWIAIALSILLAKDKKHYSEAIIRGIGERNGIVVVTAWIFAGVFGQLMVAGGLVEGLLWFGLETGVQGGLFTLLVFVIATLFASGTGTGTGTVIALIPVLFPAGAQLGADPTMVAVAVLAGAAVGDTLAPVSDTTIVSVYTQNASMSEAIKKRIPIVSIAWIIAAIIFYFTGAANGSQTTTVTDLDISTNLLGLAMLLSVVVVIVVAFMKRHIIEALIYGSLSAIIIGVVVGTMKIQDIFHVPGERGDSTGLIQDGIDSVTGAIIFTLLILAVSQVAVESGFMDAVLKGTVNTVAKTARQAELLIVISTIIISIPIAANAPALLVVGPTFVKQIGEKFKISAERTANLLAWSVNSIFYMIPWHVIVIVWYGLLVSTSEDWDLPLPSITTAFLNPYGWAVIIVVFVSIFTGWNRDFTKESE